MEAASRSPLEPLPDLPVEEPLDAAAQRAKALPAAAGATGAAPPKDPAQTGITLIDAAMLVLEPGSTVMPAPPVAATAPLVPPAALELVLEDPAVVEELLTSPPPPPVAKPAPTPPATAALSPAAAKDPPRDERVPIIRTASLTAAATKSAANKLAAASKRSGESSAAKAPPANVPTARPAPPVAKSAEKRAAVPAAAATPAPAAAPAPAPAEGLAAWTNARAAAAAAPKPTPAPPAPASTAAPKVAPAKAASTPPTAAVAAPAAPMDRDFIARNQVVERYLSGRLPLKGATEFEQFVHRHPEILDEIGLPERVNAGLRLLEASGKP